jgi:hypothetical protein
MNNNSITRARNIWQKALPIFALLLLVIGGVFIFWQVRLQQENRGRASTVTWLTAQTASAVCGNDGTVVLNYSFTNTEPSRSMLVTVSDQQSSQSASLGLVAPGITKTGTLATHLASVSASQVLFDLSWADNQSQTDTVSFSYSSLDCAAPPPVCTDVSQAVCNWDALEGATQYKVKITDLTSGTVVKSETIASSSTSLVFSSKAGRKYQCDVTTENACGVGDAGKGESSCPLPTPTPPICIPNESVCSWDALENVTQYEVKVIDTDTGRTIKSGVVNAPDTSFRFPSQTGISYQCSVNPVNVCGKGPESKSEPNTCATPTPTPTGTLTPTPTPTVTIPPTGTPSPTPTPTNQPTPTPRPTYTPIPTPTPYPTYTPAPTPTNYPTFTPAPTPTPVTIVRTQQPPPAQTVYVQPTGVPTIAPTGMFENTAIVAGVVTVLVALGGVIFLIL